MKLFFVYWLEDTTEFRITIQAAAEIFPGGLLVCPEGEKDFWKS